MNNHRSKPLHIVAVAIALLAGLGELLALQAWRLRDRFSHRDGLRG